MDTQREKELSEMRLEELWTLFPIILREYNFQYPVLVQGGTAVSGKPRFGGQTDQSYWKHRGAGTSLKAHCGYFAGDRVRDGLGTAV